MKNDDLISRRAAIEAVGYYSILSGDKFLFADKPLKELPSAEPRWIPVSERPPKNDDWQVVTILDESGDTPYRYSDFGWYFEAAKCWIVGADQRTDITAWMPLPAPWEGEERC